MPSSLQGGFVGLSRFGGIWGEKSPEKKFPNAFGDTLDGYLGCFQMVLTHFGRFRPEFGSLITLHEACRCLVACKGGGLRTEPFLGDLG